MPWQASTPMDHRLQFVADYQRRIFSMSELCERYGVSRKTGYKWVAFYSREGPAGLADHSRRPHASPLATPADIGKDLLAFRRQRPTWGAKKLLAGLRKKEPDRLWPTRSTLCGLLQRAGVVRQRRRDQAPRRPQTARVVPAYPNAVWTTDFKGHVRTGDHRYCYPLTVMDGFSRYLLDCHGMLRPTWTDTQRRFTRLFEVFKLPEVIRSDNGTPFASTALAGLSQLSVWWLPLGIALDRITPAHPEENGCHEQFHRTLKAETARPPASTCRRQQERFDRFGWLRIESTHVLDLERFVDAAIIDRIYWDEPYYLAPSEKTGSEAFAVILEAMREKDRVGIGRLVLNTRERICAVEPRGHRMLLTTLRTHEDIVTARDVGGIANLPKPNRRMLDIAETIIEQHAGTFDPSSFKDRCEDAVRDLIAHKQRGRKVTTAPPAAQAEGNVVDLMEALRRSLAGQGSGSKERAERFLERTKGKAVAKARPKRASSAESVGRNLTSAESFGPSWLRE